MNSSLESYPFLIHRLNTYNFSFQSELGCTVADESIPETLDVNNNSLTITITEPLATLVRNAIDLLEKAKSSGNSKDIVDAEAAIKLIYDDYCKEELHFELKNLKKSLELPDIITRLEGIVESKQDKTDLLQNASNGILEAVGMLKFYPENERKQELKNRLKVLGDQLKSIFTYQDIHEMVSKLQEELKQLEGNASEVDTFLTELYRFRCNYKAVTSSLNQSFLNRQEKKDLKGKMIEISNRNMALEGIIAKILNDHLSQSIVPAILRLLNEKEYDDVIENVQFSDYFCLVNKEVKKESLSEWKQSINETVGLYLITHATNYEQLNKGILLFEYVPYIDLGKERMEVCQQLFVQHQNKLIGYQSFEEVKAAIQPLIDERNTKIRRINESSSPSEMVETLKNTFNESELDINESNSKFVWLRKEKRAYRSLSQIIKDLESTDEEKLISIQKNTNAIEINSEDDKYRFAMPERDSSDTLNLLD